MRKSIKKFSKKIILLVLFFLLLIFFVTGSKNTIFAQAGGSCSDFQIISPSGELRAGEFSEIYFQFRVSDLGSGYKVIGDGLLTYDACTILDRYCLDPNSNGMISPSKPINHPLLISEGTHKLIVERENAGGTYCELPYTVLPSTRPPCELTVSSVGSAFPGFTNQNRISVSGRNVAFTDPTWDPSVDHALTTTPSTEIYEINVDQNNHAFSGFLMPSNFNPGNHTITLNYRLQTTGMWIPTNCQVSFCICPSTDPSCNEGQPCGQSISLAPSSEKGIMDLCGSQTTNTNFDKCNNCISTNLEPCEAGGSWTALGCICAGSPDDFIKWLLPFAIGIAGGIAIILMIIGGLQVVVSSGNPERVESGKNMITSALTGLLLIIFSIFLLRIIGVNLLGIY